MAIRTLKLFLAVVAALEGSLCFAQTRVFSTAKGSERISLKVDGTCSFVSDGGVKYGHYKINGKRITFNIARHRIEGFWYGDVIRYPTGDRYKSLTLIKTRNKSR